MPTPDSDPSATLETFTARNEQHIAALMLTESSVANSPYGDLRKAVAALEAALKLADDWEQRAMRLAAAADDTGYAILAEQRTARSGTFRNCARELRQGVGDTLAGESCG